MEKKIFIIIILLSEMLIAYLDVCNCITRFPTMWYVGPAKAQISLIRAFASRLNTLMTLKASDRTSFGVSILKGGCTVGSSECTLVKMPYC